MQQNNKKTRKERRIHENTKSHRKETTRRREIETARWQATGTGTWLRGGGRRVPTTDGYGREAARSSAVAGDGYGCEAVRWRATGTGARQRGGGRRVRAR